MHIGHDLEATEIKSFQDAHLSQSETSHNSPREVSPVRNVLVVVPTMGVNVVYDHQYAVRGAINHHISKMQISLVQI